MDDYYANPFSAVDPSSIGGPPSSTVPTVDALSSMAADAKMRAAMPMIQMAQQSQQLDLAKKQQMWQEYNDPDAVANRKSKESLDTASNKATLEALPYKTAKEIDDAKQSVMSNGRLTAAKVAEAEDMAIKAKGTPYADFMKKSADWSDTLKGADEADRPWLYQKMVEDWKGEHPGVTLPDSISTYNDKTMQHLDAAQYASLHDMQEQKKERQLAIEAQGKIDAARVGANARVTAAQTAVPKTEAAAMVADRQIMSDPNTPPEQKQAAQQRFLANSSKEFSDMLSKDPEVKGAQGQDIMEKIQNPDNPNAGKSQAKIIAQKRINYYGNHGFQLKKFGNQQVIDLGNGKVMDPMTGNTGTIQSPQ